LERQLEGIGPVQLSRPEGKPDLELRHVVLQRQADAANFPQDAAVSRQQLLVDRHPVLDIAVPDVHGILARKQAVVQQPRPHFGRIDPPR
jgi:hypothetical protein